MVQVKYIDVDGLPRIAKSWWYGYTRELTAAAGGFVEALFAPTWRQRLAAMIEERGARGVIFRHDRI
jgi:hypothetical protein